MLTEEELSMLRENLLSVVRNTYLKDGEDVSLTYSIAFAAAHVFVDGIQEYEKIKNQHVD